MNSFLLSINQFLIASSACIWYFSYPALPHRPVLRSFYRALRYHLGSLALGSSMISIV